MLENKNVGGGFPVHIGNNLKQVYSKACPILFSGAYSLTLKTAANVFKMLGLLPQTVACHLPCS